MSAGVETTELFLHAEDGVRLPATLWRPYRPPIAIALGLHSFGDYRRAYASMGPWLALRGIAMLAFDLRGFGETRPFGRLAPIERYVSDVAVAERWLDRRFGARRAFLVGESLGGALALVAAARFPTRVAGVVVAGPAVRRRQPHRMKISAAIQLAGRLVPPWSFVVDRACPLASEAAQARLTGDPRVLRRIRAGALLRAMVLSNMATIAARAVHAPTLILYGGSDGLIARSSIEALAEDLRGPVRVSILEGQPHLLLQSRDRFAAFGEVEQWMRPLLERHGPSTEPSEAVAHSQNRANWELSR